MTPDYESLVEVAYREALEPGQHALDVGAHLGRHTIPMARAVGPGGRITAFEPLAGIRAELELRLAAAQREGEGLALIELRCEALSDRDGIARFVEVREYPEYSGLRERVYDAEVTTVERRVETRTLDGLRDALPAIDLVKLDAEGAELNILRGSHRVLEGDRPLVCFEFGDNSIGEYGITSSDMFDFLDRHGYVVHSITGVELDRPGFVRSSAIQELWDYAAIPREKEELRKRVPNALEGTFGQVSSEIRQWENDGRG